MRMLKPLVFMFTLLAGCEVKEEPKPVPTNTIVNVIIGKSVVLDRDQPLICVYFDKKKALVCLPPEEAMQSQAPSQNQML